MAFSYKVKAFIDTMHDNIGTFSVAGLDMGFVRVSVDNFS
jgi:hypothetical protein